MRGKTALYRAEREALIRWRIVTELIMDYQELVGRWKGRVLMICGRPGLLFLGGHMLRA